jgi:hypothetical protein
MMVPLHKCLYQFRSAQVRRLRSIQPNNNGKVNQAKLLADDLLYWQFKRSCNEQDRLATCIVGPSTDVCVRAE